MSNQATLNSLPQSIIAPDATLSTEPLSSPVEAPVAPVIPVAPKAPEKNVTTERFLQLSKKEAALVKEREGLRKEMEAFKAQQSENDKYRKAYEMVNEIAELQKTDEIAAMRKAGFSDNAIMNLLAQAEDNSTPEEKAVKMAQKEIEKFRMEETQKQQAGEKRAQEARQKEEERTIAQFKTSIDNHVSNASEQLEYCKFYGEQAAGLIYDTISSILQDSGEMISIDEASKLVEDYYEEQDKAMNSLRKRSSYWTKKIETPAKPKEEPVVQQTLAQTTKRVEAKQFVDNRVPTKSLSNKMTPSMAVSNEKTISPQENKERLIQKYASLLKR